MLFRLLIAAVIIWLLYRLATGLLRKKWPVLSREEKSSRMVKCTHCGIYVTSEEVFAKNNRSFCCREHGLEYEKNNLS